MTHVPLEDLTDKVDSKYRLVIIAAKRSRQLNQRMAPTVQPKTYKPTYIALEEIAAGKIEYSAAPIEEVAKAGVFAEAVKPAWFREIAPEAVTAEEEAEEEEEQETEEAAPAEAEEEVAEVVPAEVEGEFVDLDQIEKANEEEEEG
jgi:DNA-directed RNA polymerase subunit omega